MSSFPRETSFYVAKNFYFTFCEDNPPPYPPPPPPGMRIRLGGCGSGVRGPGYSHKGWGGGEGVSVFWSAERHVGCGVG